MSKFYLVPITSRMVYTSGQVLFDLLKKVDENLYQRELQRIQKSYYTDHCDSTEIQFFNQMTHSLFQEKGIPDKIVVIGDEDGYSELVTRSILTCDNSSYMEVFSVSQEDVICFIEEESNYSENVERLFSNAFLNEKNSQSNR